MKMGAHLLLAALSVLITACSSGIAVEGADTTAAPATPSEARATAQPTAPPSAQLELPELVARSTVRSGGYWLRLPEELVAVVNVAPGVARAEPRVFSYPVYPLSNEDLLPATEGDLETAIQFLNNGEGVDHIAIFLEPGADADEVAQTLQAALGDQFEVVEPE